jgi:hypothetical protein
MPPSNRRPMNRPFHTFTAADLSHLPSLEQLQCRSVIVLQSNRKVVRIEDGSDVCAIVLANLRLFVLRLLEHSLKHTPIKETGITRRRIEARHVVFVIQQLGQFGQVVSPELLGKYLQSL